MAGRKKTSAGIVERIRRGGMKKLCGSRGSPAKGKGKNIKRANRSMGGVLPDTEEDFASPGNPKITGSVEPVFET